MNSNAPISMSGETVKILFLGQCLQYGYEGVNASSTFPNVASSLLKKQFPYLRFKFDFKFLYHPTGLKTLLRHRLLLTKPDITIINLPAMYAARPWRVNALYEMAPEVVDTARSFMQRVEAKVNGQGTLSSTTLLDKTLKQHPPLTIAAYERLINEAVEYAKQISSSRLVFIGPGTFNEDTDEDYPIHSPALWASVNEMVLRLGRRHSVPVINAQECLVGFGGGVFIPNNHRFSRLGHEIVGREVANVITSEVATLSRKAMQ